MDVAAVSAAIPGVRVHAAVLALRLPIVNFSAVTGSYGSLCGGSREDR